MSLLCGTVSMAFEKSRMAISTWILLSLYFIRSCNVAISYVSHENPVLKPCWSMLSILYFSKCVNICLHIICSITLQHMHVSDTGV